MDKSTDKLRDHVCDKGGGRVKKFEIFMDVIDGSPLTYIGLYSTFPPMINSLQHDPERLRLDVEYLDDVVLLLREAAEEHGLEHGRRHRQEHAVTAEDLEITIRFGELHFF